MITLFSNQKEILPLQLNASDHQITFGIHLDPGFSDSLWFCLNMSVTGGDDSRIRLDWAESPDSEPFLYMTHALIPNCTSVFSFPISEQHFGLKSAFLPPYGVLRKGDTNGKPVKKNSVHFVKITITSEELCTVSVTDLFFSEVRPKSILTGQPVLDRFGQRIAGTWDSKISDEKELSQFLQNELAASQTASYPDGWSHWGGWMGIRKEATGFFRTEKAGNRWWLIDPDGYAFLSNGVCYAERAGIFSFTEEYRDLHEWLPEKDGEYKEAWSTAANIPQYIVRNGSDGADQKEMFNFSRANLIRIFGDSWYEAYTSITSARLRKMGFNTVGVGTNDYFDEQTSRFLTNAKIPYVITFRDFPLTRERIFRDFPDVYSDEYAGNCRDFAHRSLDGFQNDPYLIGYFVTNEPEWLFSEDVNLAVQLFSGTVCPASKHHLINHLQKKYQQIEKLNSSWNTSFADFADLMAPLSHPDSNSSEAAADFAELETLLIRKYCVTVCEALRQADPNHLNLGMRYSWISDKTLQMDMSCFDVFSINCYDTDAVKQANRVAAAHDMPIIVGEWHFGAKECGLPAFGLKFTETQNQRAEACRHYSEAAAAHSHIVGTHYFEYNDQPYFGRFDGECYQIGLNDVCHRPYKDVCKMFEAFAKEMYEIAVK